jgi:hypothetical protein
MGSEQTPAQTRIDHRWDSPKGKADREEYDFMFDQALNMLTRDEKAVPALIMAILNEWEKNPRSVPIQVISRCLDVCHENDEIVQLMAEASPLFLAPERS